MMPERISRTFWNKHPERVVLASIRRELDRPIMVIRGYGLLLLKEDLPEDEKRRAAQQIVDYAEFLQSLRDSMDEYLQEPSQLPPAGG